MFVCRTNSSDEIVAVRVGKPSLLMTPALAQRMFDQCCVHRTNSIDERMLSLPTPGEVGDDTSHVYFKDIILPASDESEDESESQHSESGDSALQAERELRRTQTRKKKMRVSNP